MRHSNPASAGAFSPEGDDPPLARLYQEHAPAVLAYLRLRIATPEEAEDLLLEVFLAAVQQARLLDERPHEAQRAWLRRVASHKLADHYRRDRTRRHVPLDDVAETLYADEAHAPERLALNREEADRLRALLDRLPPLARQVIALRFSYGLSCAEIAEALGKREGAVRKQLWRALNQVRALYQQQPHA